MWSNRLTYSHDPIPLGSNFSGKPSRGPSDDPKVQVICSIACHPQQSSGGFSIFGWVPIPCWLSKGRIEMPQVPRHLWRCTVCATTAIGDERHCVFDCPHFQGLRQQHAQILQDSHDAMRSLMWHKDQKSVCALVLAIVNEAQTA